MRSTQLRHFQLRPFVKKPEDPPYQKMPRDLVRNNGGKKRVVKMPTLKFLKQ